MSEQASARSSYLHRLASGLTDPSVAALNSWNLSAQNVRSLLDIAGQLGGQEPVRELASALAHSTTTTREQVMRDYLLTTTLSYLSAEERRQVADLAILESATGRVNAVSLLDPWGSPVIVLDLGAQMWLRVLAKALLMADDPGTHQTGLTLLQNTMTAFATADTAGMRRVRSQFDAVRNDGDLEQRAIWNAWATFTHVFVILHEVGHVLHDDLTHPSRDAADAQARELRADSFAINRLVKVTTNPYATVPVYAFMSALAACEAMNPAGVSASHPGWSIRARACRERTDADDIDDLAVIDATIVASIERV